jgi:hypothetical protein
MRRVPLRHIRNYIAESRLVNIPSSNKIENESQNMTNQLCTNPKDELCIDPYATFLGTLTTSSCIGMVCGIGSLDHPVSGLFVGGFCGYMIGMPIGWALSGMAGINNYFLQKNEVKNKD